MKLVKTALIESHYLPCIAFFSAVSDCDVLVVEKYEHYRKQSFRNRCYIRGPHQVETLIIPVTGKRSKIPVWEVRIDYSQKWLNNHWRTLKTAYGNAPFFAYYGPELQEMLLKKPDSLYDLNFELLKLCLAWLKSGTELQASVAYEKTPAAGVTDLRGAIDLKKSGSCNRFYKSVEYQQVFGSKFVPNLSLVDLIFNQGPGARDIVKASGRNEQ